jgi:hypothetical protein
MHVIGSRFRASRSAALHLLERAPVVDCQVGDRVLEPAAEGWVVLRNLNDEATVQNRSHVDNLVC